MRMKGNMMVNVSMVQHEDEGKHDGQRVHVWYNMRMKGNMMVNVSMAQHEDEGKHDGQRVHGTT